MAATSSTTQNLVAFIADLLRDSSLGQIIRLIFGHRVLPYADERSGFHLPSHYTTVLSDETKSDSLSSDSIPEVTPPVERVPNLEAHEPKDEIDLERTRSLPIVPVKTSDGFVLVDWWMTDDPENPQNWPQWKKLIVLFQISLYTFVVYSASAIYVPSEGGVMKTFGVSQEAASGALALYVLAYGVGPLFFSPLSEIPLIGRNPPYLVSLAIFITISIPTAMVTNFPGFLVLRFLQGYFGSPGLATGGASLSDIYSQIKQPYALTVWMSAMYCGPALGILLSAYSVAAETWRWSLWEILWMAGPVFILLFLCLPETSAPNILLRRAKRLRNRTGNCLLMSRSEIDEHNIKFAALFLNASIKPAEICIKDPAVMFVNIYSALIYGIYYSFFESFPLVYTGYYGMSFGQIGLIFLNVLVGCGTAITAYWSYLFFVVEPKLRRQGPGALEYRLIPALFAVFGPPVGLFLFAWTARSSIHWIVPTIGITIFSGTTFVIFQCITVYIPSSYPGYAASLFAGNDFFRSAFAAASIMFSGPMFQKLGIAKGVSLLGGLSFMGIIGMFSMYHYGAFLRSKSKFAVA